MASTLAPRGSRKRVGEMKTHSEGKAEKKLRPPMLPTTTTIPPLYYCVNRMLNPMCKSLPARFAGQVPKKFPPYADKKSCEDVCLDPEERKKFMLPPDLQLLTKSFLKDKDILGAHVGRKTAGEGEESYADLELMIPEVLEEYRVEQDILELTKLKKYESIYKLLLRGRGAGVINQLLENMYYDTPSTNKIVSFIIDNDFFREQISDSAMKFTFKWLLLSLFYGEDRETKLEKIEIIKKIIKSVIQTQDDFINIVLDIVIRQHSTKKELIKNILWILVDKLREDNPYFFDEQFKRKLFKQIVKEVCEIWEEIPTHVELLEYLGLDLEMENKKKISEWRLKNQQLIWDLEIENAQDDDDDEERQMEAAARRLAEQEEKCKFDLYGGPTE